MAELSSNDTLARVPAEGATTETGEGGRSRALRRPKRGSPWPRRVVFLLIAVAAAAWLPRAFKKKPLEVKTARVERGTVRDEVSSAAAGEVMAEKRAMVRAELAARVVEVKKRRGDRVTKGEPIVVLDAADLAARLAQAEATLSAQRAQLAQASARVSTVARQAERAETLWKSGAGTQQLAEDAKLTLAEAGEARNAAQGLFAQAQAAVQVARVAYRKARLEAPFDGLLVEVYPDPGEQLAPAAPVFEIIDDSRLHVEAPIDEADIGKVKVGQPATLKLDALPGRKIAGQVARLGPAVRKDLKGTRSLSVEIEVTDLQAAGEAGLKVGMSANVDILAAEKADVVNLPTTCIIGRGAKRKVYLLVEGKAQLREVEVGLTNWDRSEILSGAQVGDVVIASLNQKELADGVPVVAEAQAR
jgi:HlyD family secretion protein